MRICTFWLIPDQHHQKNAVFSPLSIRVLIPHYPAAGLRPPPMALLMISTRKSVPVSRLFYDSITKKRKLLFVFRNRIKTVNPGHAVGKLILRLCPLSSVTCTSICQNPYAGKNQSGTCVQYTPIAFPPPFPHFTLPSPTTSVLRRSFPIASVCCIFMPSTITSALHIHVQNNYAQTLRQLHCTQPSRSLLLHLILFT